MTQHETGNIRKLDSKPARPTKAVDVATLFPDLSFKKAINIEQFVDPGPLTPVVNPFFRFSKDELMIVLMSIKNGDATYLKGHSGTGKTDLVNQVAARLNYNVVQINFDGSLTRADLMGDFRLIGGETVFKYGLIPFAFTEPGTIVLLDEVDACPPETAFCLQRAVSQEKKFLLPETNEQLSLHSQNVVIATANTNGMGDDTSLYVAGTNVQNFSFLNRFKTTVEIDYIKPADEEWVLTHMFPDPNLADYITSAVRVLNSCRDAFKAGTVSVPLTTRDGINWIEKIQRFGGKPMKAARYSFLDRMPKADALAVAQYIQRCFSLNLTTDDTTYLNKK